MANVSDFVNQLNGTGDFARANLFEVLIPGTGDSKYLAKTASLPTATVGAIEVPYQNRKWKVPGDRTYADWTVTFLNDRDYILRNELLAWQNRIQGFQSFSGDRGVALGENNDIHRTLIVQPKSRDLEDVSLARHEFACWPTEIGSIELSWDSADTVQEYTVTFAVSWDYGAKAY